MDQKYRHTPEMGEISGFGGDYEDGCQVMLDAGVQWLNDHPEADLQYRFLKNVYGLVSEDSDDARALSKHIRDAADDAHPDGGVTGAMHHAVVLRLIYIQAHGWESYCEELLRKDSDENPA